jgi:hypothetical protein
VESTAAADPALEYPRFLAGESRAPPEDVGGIPGFEEFLKAMAKLRHPERKRMIEWYGEVLEPNDINPALISARIAKLSRRRAIRKAAFAKSKSLLN